MNEQFVRLKVQRKPEILAQVGFSGSTLQNRINDGLWVSLFSLGGRAKGALDIETTTLVAAMADGESDDFIRAEVISLHERRKERLASLTSQTAEAA